MNRRILIALAVFGALVSLVVANVARAERPIVLEQRNTLTRDFPGTPDCQQLGYAFTYSEHFDVVRTVTDDTDESGAVIREVLHVNFVGTATNDATGKVLPVDGSRHLVFDFVAGTFTETGVLRHVTARGEGIVLHQSGRVVLPLTEEPAPPLFEAGPHQLGAGDLEEFCAALAG